MVSKSVFELFVVIEFFFYFTLNENYSKSGIKKWYQKAYLDYSLSLESVFIPRETKIAHEIFISSGIKVAILSTWKPFKFKRFSCMAFLGEK